MGAPDDQGFFMPCLLALKLDGPAELGMVFLNLSLTQQDFKPEDLLRSRDSRDAIDSMVVHPRRHLESKVFEDRMDGIDKE